MKECIYTRTGANAKQGAPCRARGGETVKLVQNVVKSKYIFDVQYMDGNIEELSVEAESEDAARLLLPECAVNVLLKEKR